MPRVSSNSSAPWKKKHMRFIRTRLCLLEIPPDHNFNFILPVCLDLIQKTHFEMFVSGVDVLYFHLVNSIDNFLCKKILGFCVVKKWYAKNEICDAAGRMIKTDRNWCTSFL